MPVEVSGDLVTRIIAYLDNPEDQRGVWRGLHFMESNALDLSLRSEELHGYLTNEDNSPIEAPEQLSHEQEREIILTLRDVIRRDLGLAPLTAEERRLWEYRYREPLRWSASDRTALSHPDRYRTTAAERQTIRELVGREEPEILRALNLFVSHAVEMGNDNRKKHSWIWIKLRLERIIGKMRPELGRLDVIQIIDDLIEETWRSVAGSPGYFSTIDEEGVK